MNTLPEAWKPFTKEPDAAPVVTPEQLDLVKRTVANGATADELKLYLYDCQRQGVHPLDKLIHYTKRSGKYTPITSIDFMRTRAADTGEYAGSDDAVFTPKFEDVPVEATVTVWRLVQGQKCAFTATARWSEYKPEQNDFMWKRMPHTMLAKCAEALALRKGFPRQLAGLYAKEEMDQAETLHRMVIEAPIDGVVEGRHKGITEPSQTSEVALNSRRGPAQDAEADEPCVQVSNPAPVTNLPAGAVYITKVEGGSGKAKGFIHHSGQPTAPSLHGQDGLAVYDEKLMAYASEACQLRTPVRLEFKTAASGKEYVKAIRAVKPEPEFRPQGDNLDEIPF